MHLGRPRLGQYFKGLGPRAGPLKSTSPLTPPLCSHLPFHRSTTASVFFFYVGVPHKMLSSRNMFRCWSKYIYTHACMHTYVYTCTVWKPLIHSNLHHCVMKSLNPGKRKWIENHKRCYYLLVNLFHLWVRARAVVNSQRKALRFSSNWNCFIWKRFLDSWMPRTGVWSRKEGAFLGEERSVVHPPASRWIKKLLKSGLQGRGG